MRTGMIPRSDWPLLFAAFNGGFQSIHGNYGMMVDGKTVGNTQDDACTIAIDKKGTVRIRTWKTIAATRRRMFAYRQTPHCLVERGKRHPDLDENAYDTHWGAVVGGKTVIRRSALGIGRDGKILFFGLGDSLTARSLADGMRAAGSQDVAQLDVNQVFPRFVLFSHHGKKPDRRVFASAALGSGYSFSPDDYVRIPMVRDFFYLTLMAANTPSSSVSNGASP